MKFESRALHTLRVFSIAALTVLLFASASPFATAGLLEREVLDQREMFSLDLQAAAPLSPLAPQSTDDARWVGNGASDAWTDNNNWSSTNPPTAISTTNTYYGDVGDSRKLTDMSGYGSYFSTGHFYFDATGSQFNLGGTNTSSNFVRIFGGIENGPTYVSAATVQPTQTFSATIALGADASFIARNGDLLIASANIYGDNHTLNVNSGVNTGRTITFTGVLNDGSGGLRLNIDTLTAVLNGVNLYTGDTTVNSGILQFGTAASSTGSANNSIIRLGPATGDAAATINLATTAGGQTIGSVINPRGTGTGLLAINSQNTSGTNTLSNHIGTDKNFTITQAAGGALNITQAHTDGGTNGTGLDIKSFTLTLSPSATGTINITGDIYNGGGSGGGLIVNGGGTVILAGGANNTFTGGVAVTGATLQVGSATGLGTGNVTLNDAAIFNNTVSLTNQTRVFNLTTAANATVTFNTGAALSFNSSGTRGISGGSSTLTLVKSGAGNTFTLTNNNQTTYLGNWRIDSGTLATSNDGALGDVNNDITFNGGTFSWGAASNWAVPSTRTLTLNNVAGNTLNIATGGSVTLSATNQLTGSGAVTTSGSGTLALLAAQNFSGGLTVGPTNTLSVGNDGALGSGAVSFGDGSTVQSSDATAHTIANAWSPASGTSNLNLGATSTGDLTFTDTASFSLATTVKTFTVSGITATFSKVFTSTSTGGGITKAGNGTLILKGASTYTGATSVNAGTLLVANTTGSATGTGAVSTLASSGAVFAGGNAAGTAGVSGTVNINAGTSLAPGTTGNGSGTTAILKTGALTLASTSNFRVDLNNTTAGSGYDQVISAGSTITGSNLVVTAGSSLAVGNIFYILENTGINTNTGTFAGQANLSTVNASNNGDTFTINYAALDPGTGMTGISLTVTAVPEPSTWVAAALVLASIAYTQRKRLTRVISRA